MFIAKSDERRYTLGVAYPRAELDAHKEFMSADQLEEAAWRAMEKGIRIGLHHEPGTDGAGRVVESYIWRGADWKVGKTVVKAGDWLVGVIWTPEAWGEIKKGAVTGYSMQGFAQRRAKALRKAADQLDAASDPKVDPGQDSNEAARRYHAEQRRRQATVNEDGHDVPEQMVAFARSILRKMSEEQRQRFILEFTGTLDERADLAVERVTDRLTTKSKAEPGSFNALIDQHVSEMLDPNGFTNSFETEKPVEVFSKERMAEEAAERVAKDKYVSPTQSVWHREPRRRGRIIHVGR